MIHTMYNNNKHETHNKSVQQSATLNYKKDTPKDYALELEFLGMQYGRKSLSHRVVLETGS